LAQWRLPGTPSQQRKYVRWISWLIWISPVFILGSLAFGDVRGAAQTVVATLLLFVTRRFWIRRMEQEARSGEYGAQDD
jgi:hypothetical protein